ncbi:MAG: glycosyltransferase family 4 protein [Desulfovibrio aminophilus]|uniref:glycosyltransferase family 4 protein n=1 Tax=Desulfovibrio aminophilus TaxID=81425 RepID=UPI000482DAE7|nr:glycosyltransferase family 4 protein [Desulfovibrio aminophilus]
MSVANARLAVVMPRMSSYGGAEGFGLRLAGALAGAGHAVDFICARQEVEAPQGVRVIRVGRFGPFKALKTLWFTLAAGAAIRRGRYDLVFGLGKTLSQDILRIGGGPLPVFWRLSKLAWRPGWPRTMKMLRRRLSPANWLSMAIEARQARSARVVVCVSTLVRDWLLEAHPELARSDVRVIYNRPDLSRFHVLDEEGRARLRAREGLEPEQVVIATAATNFALKGIAPLLRALALLPERFVLRVAGGRGAGHYLQLARELGVEDRVRFLGRVEDMPGFYNAADVFCLATYYDACSNAVLEALACGCRTVSSRFNGSAAFLPSDKVFDDPGDHAALARLLERVAGEPRPGEFVWPDDVACGLDPYLALTDECLRGKSQQGA